MEKPKYTERIVSVPGMEFNGKNIRVQEFETEDGVKRQWESVVSCPTNVGTIMVGLTADKKIVTIKIYRLPVNDWTIELPGGMVEEGEDPIEAVQREFLEETGYKGENIKELASGYAWAGGTDQKYTIFVAENCKKISEPQLEAVEQFLGVDVIEQDTHYLMEEVVSKQNYDPLLGQALLALQVKGYIK